VAIIDWAFAQKMPLIGICLGMQAIAAAFGGSVVRAERLIHGGTSKIDHDGVGIFEGIPQRFNATRYHSLAVANLPPSLVVTAHSDDGEVMALRHESEEIVGVQFHPEAVLTEHGHQLLQNWLKSLEK